jgi:hypothetical protein
MNKQSTMFSDVSEAKMDSQLRATLGDLRSILASVKPTNVLATDTWTRRDMGGYDFVMPHRHLAGFALVARSGDTSDEVSLAYSSCRRRDRGDEFDAAFAVDRAAMVQTVLQGEEFPGMLWKALLNYLQRELRVVRYLDSDSEVVGTEIFWPSEQDGEQVLLWKEHVRGISLRKSTPVESVTAFDERVSRD